MIRRRLRMSCGDRVLRAVDNLLRSVYDDETMEKVAAERLGSALLGQSKGVGFHQRRVIGSS
jgi:hypothetical protein